MEAYLVIEPPTGEGNWPSKEDALKAISAEKVVFGIIDEAIIEAINKHQLKPVLIAKGKAPVNGADAEINYLFETGVFRKAFTEDEFGRVDYRQVQNLQNVTVGQKIAEKIPPTPGEPGMNVRGEEVKANPGRDKQIKLGKNVAWTEDNLAIVSTINGEPSLANNKISVHEVHEIKGDVNFQSGNINFLGSVIIQGNVESGFKIEADGDVTIYGNVDSADIKAGGNIFIKGGISGMDKGKVICGGDFSAKYIEHATVDCEGTITVREAIMHCQVNADQKVVCEGGKGLIVGGLTRSGEEISAKTIGSRLGTVTELEVGVKPKLKLEIQELEEQLKVNKESLDKAEKAIGLLSKMPNLPDDRKEMLQNLIKTSYALKAQINEADAKRQELLEEILVKSKEKGRIRVKEVIYPGIRVTMGKTTIMIQDEIKFAVLVYNEGEIQIQPYR
ncbi:MAG: FapA family protein, partial [Bacteroidota bacterium]